MLLQCTVPNGDFMDEYFVVSRWHCGAVVVIVVVAFGNGTEEPLPSTVMAFASTFQIGNW